MNDLTTNQERQISSNSANQIAPDIDNNRIVWLDYRNGKPDIFMYDLISNQEKRITTDIAKPFAPTIKGNRIVWVDNRSGNGFSNGYVYMFDLNTNQERRISTSGNAINVDIDGDRIVWSTYENNLSSIRMYDLSINQGFIEKGMP